MKVWSPRIATILRTARHPSSRALNTYTCFAMTLLSLADDRSYAPDTTERPVSPLATVRSSSEPRCRPCTCHAKRSISCSRPTSPSTSSGRVASPQGRRSNCPETGTSSSNPRQGTEGGDRRLLVGRTDGERPLTLVIERTQDPTTWLVVTGWVSTATERR